MYIVIAIIAFGFLIAVHELGHFTAAKLLKVRVIEFAIGMGPKLLKKQGKNTLYTLRMFPFGGFCAMDEDSAPEDESSFTAQRRWKRVIILAAGGIANLLAAFIIVVILVSQMSYFASATLVDLAEGFPDNGEQGLMIGDTIHSINGERIYYMDDFPLLMQLANSSSVNIVVIREGEKVTLTDYTLERREYMTDGEMRLRYGLHFSMIDATFTESAKYSCYMTYNFIRLIRFSIAQLVSGAAGVRDFAGPVAIVDTMNSIGREAPTIGSAIASIANFTALIGVNIALINLLPIPAMDGGRILFLFITWIIEKMMKRNLDPKYEGYIHTTALVLLMGFMVFVLINDVLRIVSS